MRDNDHSRLAAALRDAVREMRASTGIAYVPVDEGRTLVAATAVGRPVSLFTTLEDIDVANERYTAAIAYRTGQQTVASYPEAVPVPTLADVTMPFPYTAASTPVRAGGQMVGVLALLWVPPLGPRQLLPEDKRQCTRLADAMAEDLRITALRQARARPTSVPLFLLSGDEQAVESLNVSFLHDIQKVAAALNQTVRMEDVIDVVVKRIMSSFGAQGMVVSVLEDSRPRLLGYAGYTVDIARSSVGAPPPDPQFLENDTDLPTGQLSRLTEGTRASAVLPLVTGGRRWGTLLLGFDHPRHFSAEDRAALVSIAGLLAQCLERARSFEAEHAVARRLQQGLLPHMLPHLEELDTAARYVPAAPGLNVGGDWYDVVTLPDGNVGLVIGDVEGHSSVGAAIMGQIRSVVRAYAAEGHGPAAVLGRTNRLLAELGTDLFVTCSCIWLDRQDGTAEVACAGHPAPLLRHPDRSVVVPDPDVGVPLGLAPDTVYHSVDVTLPPGTILALYTDGLVHSRTTDLITGTEAMCRLLAEADDQRLEELADQLLDITGEGGHRKDDAALLIARYDGALPGAHRRVSRMSVQRHDLRGVRKVRQFLHEKLRPWGWESVSYEVELLSTELVTNALIHADSDVDVRLREYPDRIRVEVRDSDPRPPMPAPITVTEEAEAEAEHGRGLVIVDTLASAWGNSPSGRGKSVWFEMTRP